MRAPIRGWLFRSGLGFFLVAFAIQFVPYGHGRANPPVASEPAWDSTATRALAKQACFDCHSNETAWPVYAKVAPVSWLVQYDVTKGRAALNFSEWQRAQKEANEAHEKLLEREMPPAIYQFMHADARLNDQDRAQLARGLAKTFGRSE